MNKPRRQFFAIRSDHIPTACYGPWTAEYRLQRSEFVEVYDAAFAGVKRVLRTSTICSCTTPPARRLGGQPDQPALTGDTILVLETGSSRTNGPTWDRHA